jgi:hypothetical protein
MIVLKFANSFVVADHVTYCTIEKEFNSPKYRLSLFLRNKTQFNVLYDTEEAAVQELNDIATFLLLARS